MFFFLFQTNTNWYEAALFISLYMNVKYLGEYTYGRCVWEGCRPHLLNLPSRCFVLAACCSTGSRPRRPTRVTRERACMHAILSRTFRLTLGSLAPSDNLQVTTWPRDNMSLARHVAATRKRAVVAGACYHRRRPAPCGAVRLVSACARLAPRRRRRSGAVNLN